MGWVFANKLPSTPSRKHYSVFSEDQTHSDVLCARAEQRSRVYKIFSTPRHLLWHLKGNIFWLSNSEIQCKLVPTLNININSTLPHQWNSLKICRNLSFTQNMRTSRTNIFWRYGIGGTHFDVLWLENKLKRLLPRQVCCISVCSHLFIAEFSL